MSKSKKTKKNQSSRNVSSNKMPVHRTVDNAKSKALYDPKPEKGTKPQTKREYNEQPDKLDKKNQINSFRGNQMDLSNEKNIENFQEKQSKPLKEKQSKPLKEKQTKPLKEKQIKPLKEKQSKQLKEKKPKPIREKNELFFKLKNIFSNFTTKKIRIVLCATLAVAITVGLCCYFVLSRYDIPNFAIQEYAGINEDKGNIRKIDIGIKEQLEKVDELKIKGDKGKFKFFAKKELIFNEWDEESPFTFGNVSSNDCILIVTMVGENGEMLYRSKGIESGTYIPKMKLFSEMPYGKSKPTLVVTAYDTKTRELIGTQYTRISLVIGIEYRSEQESTGEAS